MTEKSLIKINLPRYTEAEFALKKSEAKTLFLGGKNPEDIDKGLKLRKGRTRSWAKQYNWMDERDKILDASSRTKLQEMLKQQDETFKELKIIRDKAIDAITSDEVVPRKFAEASSAYINTIEVERRLKAEALQTSFIVDIAKVLKNRIKDQALLFVIAQDLREIFNKYQEKALRSSDKIIED